KIFRCSWCRLRRELEGDCLRREPRSALRILGCAFTCQFAQPRSRYRAIGIVGKTEKSVERRSTRCFGQLIEGSASSVLGVVAFVRREDYQAGPVMIIFDADCPERDGDQPL